MNMKNNNIKRLKNLKKKFGVDGGQELVFLANKEKQTAKVGKKELPIEIVRERYPNAILLYFDFPTDEWKKQRVIISESDK